MIEIYAFSSFFNWFTWVYAPPVIRQRYGTFRTPSIAKSETHFRENFIITTCPFSQWLSNTPRGEKHSGFSISLLFSSSRPTQIATFVMSIIVNAVKRIVRRWSKSYNFYKFRKRSNVATNAPPTIAIKTMIQRIRTPRLNTYPSMILNTTTSPVNGYCIFMSTTARCCIVSKQTFTSSHRKLATLTLTYPTERPVVRILTVNTENQQSSKFTTSQVKFRAAGNERYGKIENRHFDLRYRLKGLGGLPTNQAGKPSFYFNTQEI